MALRSNLNWTQSHSLCYISSEAYMFGIAALLERRPGVGIIASITGFSTSVITLMQQASIVIGFVGACFGLVAGYYTWRIKRAHWHRLLKDKKDL